MKALLSAIVGITVILGYLACIVASVALPILGCIWLIKHI